MKRFCMKRFVRAMLTAVALAGLSAAATMPARALVEIDVNKGNIEPLPIAITDFLASDQIGAEITSVIAADLQRSGLFAPIDKGAFIEKVTNPDAAPRFEDWKVINAQALVTGRVTQEGDGRLRAEFRLWDTFAGEQLIGEQFFANKANSRHLRAADRREGLLRHARRLHRRVGTEEPAQEAPGDHGPGRRRHTLSVGRQCDNADAALLADPPGNHLHVV